MSYIPSNNIVSPSVNKSVLNAQIKKEWSCISLSFVDEQPCRMTVMSNWLEAKWLKKIHDTGNLKGCI